ncbi:MAG TPA: thioredoxin domain-containing protein, partial [Flavobacterium sp.]|nr:thioredoxin domain-containing protein [Flavobacterium sp.]
YEDVALRMLAHIVSNIDYPSAFSNWLVAFLAYGRDARQLAVTGSADVKARFDREYLPNVIAAGSEHASHLPFLKDRFQEGRTLFYVCRDKTCGLPFNDAKLTLQELRPSGGSS